MARRHRPTPSIERGEIRAYHRKDHARPDHAVAAMAAQSEGVLDGDELAACGLSHSAICNRERAGRLHRLYQGVYAVGHPNVSQKGRFIAAVKACRPDAALSHRAAAAWFGFRPWDGDEIEVTIRASATKHHPGIRAHRSALLTRADVVMRHGIPITNPVWTVVALAAVLRARELRGVVREALALQLVSVRAVAALLERLGPIRGCRNLRRILARSMPTRSELEDVVYDLIVAGGFEPPEVNKPLRLDGRIVIPDFRWPNQKLIVEADGARWHDDALARADDAERQGLLERHGETVLRIRWDEATMRPAVARTRLAEAGAPPVTQRRAW